MSFDSTTSDYLDITPLRGPARVYDKDNPPPTFAEALRMAAKDMEAMFAQGIGYDWEVLSLKTARLRRLCGPCSAGAVVLRIGGQGEDDWGFMGFSWYYILQAISRATLPLLLENLRLARGGWPEGFPPDTPDGFTIRDAAKDPDGAIDDMFACADMLEGLAHA